MSSELTVAQNILLDNLEMFVNNWRSNNGISKEGALEGELKFADSTLEDVIVSVYGTNDAVMYSTTNGNMILLENFRDIEGNELKLKFKDSEEMTA